MINIDQYLNILVRIVYKNVNSFLYLLGFISMLSHHRHFTEIQDSIYRVLTSEITLTFQYFKLLWEET
jgi:hypothetical protein